MDSVFPAMMQDYTLLLTKTGDVWFCGESMVSRDDLRSPSRVSREHYVWFVCLVRVRACHGALRHRDACVFTLSICWHVQFGQRGGGVWDGRYPTLVLGGQNVNPLACGESHMTVSTADGRAYSWGLNDWVRLGARCTE